MTLKFKRNLPLLLTLFLFVSVVAIFLGNQPLIPYTVSVEAPTASAQADSLTTTSLSSISLVTETLPIKSFINSGSVLAKGDVLSVQSTK